MKTISDFNFKTMDPEVIQKLLEGHKDILTPAAQEQNQKLHGHSCPYCGRPIDVVLQPRPFSPNRTLPKFMGKCGTCKITGILIDG